MQYRVYFATQTGYYFTEWFDTLGEALDFTYGADGVILDALHIENSDGGVV